MVRSRASKSSLPVQSHCAPSACAESLCSCAQPGGRQRSQASHYPGQSVSLGQEICCFVKGFWNVGLQRNYRDANLFSIPLRTGGWGSCAETAELCFLQFVFRREVPALKSVLIFFLFQSTKKLFSVSANF